MGAKNEKELTIGSCDIYIDSQFIGYTGDEVTFAIKKEIAEFKAGSPSIRVTGVVIEEASSIKFSFAQVNAVNLSYAMGKDGVIDELTVPGNSIVEFGGDTSLGAQHLLEAIHKFPDDRTLVIALWKAKPDVNFELAFAKGKYIEISSTWTAEEDSSKAEGKRLGRLAVEDITKS